MQQTHKVLMTGSLRTIAEAITKSLVNAINAIHANKCNVCLSRQSLLSVRCPQMHALLTSPGSVLSSFISVW
jgi:hypothetical protein